MLRQLTFAFVFLSFTGTGCIDNDDGGGDGADCVTSCEDGRADCAVECEDNQCELDCDAEREDCETDCD